MSQSAIELKYGLRSFRSKLPENIEPLVLHPEIEPPQITHDEMIRYALNHPIGAPPLRQLAKGRRSAVILVSGKTRVTGSQFFLPFIVAELETGGVSVDQVSIVFATGTHEAMTRQDIMQVIGAGLAGKVRAYGHDCRNEDGLVDIGTTSYGNRILANKSVMEADLKILTGRITHHYFAGFTGGSKSILPGICGFESIVSNHRMVMSTADNFDPKTLHGQLDDNPVHQDMVEAAALSKPDFLFNTVLDHHHRIQYCVAGHHIKAHREGCRLAEKVHKRRVERPASLVVASCGGHPYDVNLMQTIKTIFNCEKAVAPGGTLMLIAECAKGIHSGFFRWFAHPTFSDLAKTIVENYDLTGHNTYLVRRFLQQHRIMMVTSLPDDEVKKMGITPVQNINDVIKTNKIQADRPVYIVPYGGTTLMTVQET